MSVTPPEDLRPAQLGIVLRGRVIFGHVTATLLDLAHRGFLELDEVAGPTGPDWVLTGLCGPPATGRALLRYEATLLNGLFARRAVVRMSQCGDSLTPVLDRCRGQLRRDAVRHGRIRPWRRNERSAHGTQLLRQIQGFRREVRAMLGSGDPAVLADLVPYAMVFGLRGPSSAAENATHVATEQPRDAEELWSRVDRCAASWLAACAGAVDHDSDGDGSGEDHHGDFARRWSAPHEGPGRPGRGARVDGVYGGSGSYGAVGLVGLAALGGVGHSGDSCGGGDLGGHSAC